MELLFLGTSAAEGWPAPFCVCEYCEQARKRGGPNIRSRSGALLDEDLKIDFSPDTLMQMQRVGRSLVKVRSIVFTHPHSDHFVPSELEWAAHPYTTTPPPPVTVYGNEEVLQAVGQALPQPGRHNLELRLMRPFEPVTTPTGDTILPLPADHAEGAMVLRITRDGQSLFYGHDSGLYPDATMDALGDGTRLAIAVFDCTNGAVPSSNRGHMGVDGVKQMVEEFRSRGLLAERSQVIATHFSHNGKMMHEDLMRAFLPDGIEVAYDGMVVRA